VSLDTDPGFATGDLTVTRSAIGTGSAVGNGDVISDTDARLATRCAAVSGDVWSRSTGCTVGDVGMSLDTDAGLTTGGLAVAGGGVGAGCAVGLVLH